jgi:hypothetical protein
MHDRISMPEPDQSPGIQVPGKQRHKNAIDASISPIGIVYPSLLYPALRIPVPCKTPLMLIANRIPVPGKMQKNPGAWGKRYACKPHPHFTITKLLATNESQEEDS